MISRAELGKQVAKARKHYSKKVGRKVTQADIAKKIGISRSHICDIEGGNTFPSVQMLYLIANACEVPLSWFDKDVIDTKDIPKELQSVGIEYLAMAKDLKDKGLTSSEIESLIRVIKKMERN